MKNICFINGSPRQSQSSSLRLIHELQKIIGEEAFNVSTIHASKAPWQQDCSLMLQADALIIAFPLYCYALPGLLTEFLENYYEYVKTKQVSPTTNVYAIINCGFPEASHNDHAAQIIQNFCCKLGLTWRFALEIGGGGIISANLPLGKILKANIYKGLEAIAQDIESIKPFTLENILVNAVLPKWLYLWFGKQSWLEAAKKNNLTKQDLDNAPYA